MSCALLYGFDICDKLQQNPVKWIYLLFYIMPSTLSVIL